MKKWKVIRVTPDANHVVVGTFTARSAEVALTLVARFDGQGVFSTTPTGGTIKWRGVAYHAMDNGPEAPGERREVVAARTRAAMAPFFPVLRHM